MMCSFWQAGSDSLLTGRAFFAMTEIYFEVLDNRETALARLGHSGEYGNDAKVVGKMPKSVMQLISIHF